MLVRAPDRADVEPAPEDARENLILPRARGRFMSDYATASSVTRPRRRASWCPMRLGTWTLLACLLGGALGVHAVDDKLATFFMGRIKYSANDGNDCGNVGRDLMNLVSRASTLK